MHYTYNWLLRVNTHPHFLAREFQAPTGTCSGDYGACTAKVIPYSTVFSRCKVFVDWAYAKFHGNKFRESIIIAVSHTHL